MIDVAGLKARADIVAVVGRYVELQKRGHEFIGRCVSGKHVDNNPSMYVVPDKQFVKCFSCEFHEDVIGFVRHMEGGKEKCSMQRAAEIIDGTDYTTPEFKRIPAIKRPDRITSKPPADEAGPDMTLRGLGTPSASWCYRDADGLPLGWVARYDTPEGKEVRCWTWGQRGDEPPAWGCGHWTRPRPLYGLDRLAARPAAPVLIVEGEKAADAAGTLIPGMVAVTWPGGAESYDRADWQPLAGRTVTLWPDADPPGVEAMARLGSILADPAGLACTVSVLDVEGMPEGYDAADSLADGLSAASVIQWAKSRKRALAVPQPAAVAAAPIAEAGPEPEPPSVVVMRSQDELPDLPVSAFEDTGENPPADDLPAVVVPIRPRLSVVDGGAALKLDPKPLPFALSDDMLGDYFAEQYGESLKYVPERSSADAPYWLEWTGDGWRQDTVRGWFGKAIDVTRRALYWPEANGLQPKERRSLNSAGKASSLLQVARVHPRIVTRSEQWDANRWRLGIPGGSIDLETGALHESVKEHYITKRCSVAPARGDHPLFDAVLSRAAGGDVAMLEYLWRWFGYMLTGDTREECFLFLHGPGGSGKSTLTTVLTDILGDYAITCPMEMFLEQKHTKHSEELARLDGARLALTSETDEGGRWNESRIKWLTGRNKTTARYLYGHSFEFLPQFKLLIEGNHRPGLKSVGEEMRRRIHLVEYGGSIPASERDQALKVKLKREYPAILHSMVEACVAWQERGLATPATVTANVSDYLEAEDTIGAWLEECCDLGPLLTVTASAAYKSYSEWSEQAGEYILSKKRFGQKLEDRGNFKRTRSAAARLFNGLRLKSDQPAADWRD